MSKTKSSQNTFQTYNSTSSQYSRDEMLYKYNEMTLMLMCFFVTYLVLLWIAGYFDYNNKKHKKLSDDKYADKYKEVDLRQRMEFIKDNSTSVTNIPPFQSFIVHLSYKNKQIKDDTKDETKTCANNKNDYWENKNILQTTSVNLINEFGANTVYCHGNEIIIVFQQQYPKKMLYDETKKMFIKRNHLFKGRTSDILARITSFASFTASSVQNTKDKSYFDAKVIVFPRQYEINNYLLMHAKYAFINCVNKYATEKYTSDKLFGKSTNTLVKMLFADGIDITNNNDRFGYFVKKHMEKNIEKKHTEHKTHKNYSDHYYRLSTVILSFPVKYNKNFVTFVESKYYDSAVQLKDIVEQKC